jgi:hypothetical protein
VSNDTKPQEGSGPPESAGARVRLDGATREGRVFQSALERYADDGFFAFAGLEGAADALARAARAVGAPLERLTEFVRARARDVAARQRLTPSAERELAVHALARVVHEYERPALDPRESAGARWLVLPDNPTTPGGQQR